MTEHDLEDLLRRYRPLGPPPELRARIAAAAAPAPRTWPWAAAAAALLAGVCITHLSTRSVYERLGESVAPAQESTFADYPALERAIEGDPLLRMRLAAIAHQEQSQAAGPGGGDAGTWR
jgi:hypothetical protein